MFSKLSKRLSGRRRSSIFAGTYNYTVYVQTGDRPKAGTDANVYIVLHGEDKHSEETKLDVLFHDDFERGQLDKFKIKHQPFSEVDSIELWRDTSGFKKEWHIDTIMIVNKETRVKTVFPVFRWIRPHYRYSFVPLDTSLPQDDTRIAQRQRELEEKRLLYELEAKHPGWPLQVKTLPPDEQFSFEFLWDFKKTKAKLTLTGKLLSIKSGHWKSVADIKTIFSQKTFAPPVELNRWCDDKAFGRQRLAGVHNTAIRLCTEIPKKMDITSEKLDPFLESSTLPLALSDRRIFIVDHEILDGIPTKDDHVVCSPIALFFQRNDGCLVPIAIQLFQEKSQDNPVFLPSDPKWTWILAKMWFNNADVAVHQAAQHMCNTHLLMEGIYVITQRNLSQSHPIFKLLMPHILYIIPINVRASERIMNPGGWIEKVLAIGVEGMQEIVSRQKSIWRMDVEGTLPADFRERGVNDYDILPQYYYRDDGTLLYDAVRTYVMKYIKLYYDTDDKIEHDQELKNWREEMIKPYTEGGLELHGVPGNHGHFVTKSDVCQVLTWIIFTCSVGHASLNKKQYDEYAFPPNCPSIMKGVPPTDKSPRTEQDILEALPDKQTTVDTMTITNILSQGRGNPMGTFDVNFVYDPKAVKVVKELKEDLKRISSTIKSRNKRRPVPYDVLDPEKISNTMCI